MEKRSGDEKPSSSHQLVRLMDEYDCNVPANARFLFVSLLLMSIVQMAGLNFYIYFGVFLLGNVALLNLSWYRFLIINDVGFRSAIMLLLLFGNFLPNCIIYYSEESEFENFAEMTLVVSTAIAYVYIFFVGVTYRRYISIKKKSENK